MRIIGIDTGGTCTDAVLFDTDTANVLSAGKAQTTRTDLEEGIVHALDQLDPALLKTADMVTLSTTLATNAAVENKGARAKLLLIGFDPKIMDHLKEIYASYGLTDQTLFIVLDAKPEGAYARPYDPDWEDLRKRCGEYFDDCDSVGIVQMSPRANGARFELSALKILSEELEKPLTIASEISNETDILKTCAGTLLDARLVPLMTELIKAVRRALKARGLDCPISIVRSDGIVMSEQMAMLHPVETLMSGPAASAIGGCVLAGEKNGIIIDMGGTTTDIVVVKDNVPEKADKGIYIGQWKTMVKGIRVATFGLGGDSAVRYHEGQVFLDTERVIPISMLSSVYESVLPALQRLEKRHYCSSRYLHEFYVLQKDITGRYGYTDREQQICHLLQAGPLITAELCEHLGIHPLFLNTTRLESEGIVIKSGLTPTDMMILKGDFQAHRPSEYTRRARETDEPAEYCSFDSEAARTAIRCLCINVRDSADAVPDLVYEMVVHRMYSCIGKVLLQHQYPRQKHLLDDAALEELLDCFYEQACKAESSDGSLQDTAMLNLTCSMPLIGVGAPIHVFLPKVACLLHTNSILPLHEDVANAIGAAVSRRVATASCILKAEYDGAMYTCLSIHENGVKHTFTDTQEAITFAKGVLEKALLKKALLQGIKGEPHIEMTVEENRIGHVREGALLEIVLRGQAT